MERFYKYRECPKSVTVCKLIYTIVGTSTVGFFFLPVGTFDTGTHSVGKQYRQNEANAVGFFMLNNNTQSPSFFLD